MYGQAQTVSGAVKETNGAVLRMLRFVACVGEGGGDFLVHLLAVHTGADHLDRGELGLAHGGDEVPLGVARAAAEEGAGHVTVVAGLRDGRENIEDDELVGPERAGTAVVRVAGLVAAGDDGVEGGAALAEDGALDGEFQDL